MSKPGQADFDRAREAASHGRHIEAVRHLRLAAELAHAEAQFALANAFYSGRGTPKDYRQAAHWYRLAAGLGETAAEGALGHLYENGLGVEKDLQAAAAYYRQSANGGNAIAQRRLGSMYFEGRGVKQDFGEAARFARLAAEQGDAQGQSALGYLLRNGLGVPKDDAAAVAWFEKAAHSGNAQAQYSLALCYEVGAGTPRDIEKAAKWVKLSADQGHPQAKEAMGRIQEALKNQAGLNQAEVELRAKEDAMKAQKRLLKEAELRRKEAERLEEERRLHAERRAKEEQRRKEELERLEQLEREEQERLRKLAEDAETLRRREEELARLEQQLKTKGKITMGRLAAAMASLPTPGATRAATPEVAPSPQTSPKLAKTPSTGSEPNVMTWPLPPAAVNQTSPTISTEPTPFQTPAPSRPITPPPQTANPPSPTTAPRSNPPSPKASVASSRSGGRTSPTKPNGEARSEDLTPDTPRQKVIAPKMTITLEKTGYWIEEDEIEIDRDHCLGKGGFSEVFRGKYRGMDVAVKIIPEKYSKSSVRGQKSLFQAEVRLCAELPEHVNVVPLLGYHVSPSFMVTKFYAAGTLKHHLARNEWSRKLAMPLLVQVATGMLFLHSKGIVHHDLKADNVLVDDSADPPVAKIADFGLAKVRVSVGTEEKPGQAVQFRGNEGATVRFAPPEYFDGGEMGKAADAWMFGMMCYQVLSKGQEPYDYCPYDRVLIRAINRGDRPQRPEETPDALWELMQECWQKDPLARPTFEKVTEVLTSVAAAMA